MPKILTPEREAAIRRKHRQMAGYDICERCTEPWPCSMAGAIQEVDRLREVERAAIAALHWWRSWQATPEYRRRPLDPGLAGLIAAMDLLAEAEYRPSEEQTG